MRSTYFAVALLAGSGCIEDQRSTSIALSTPSCSIPIEERDEGAGLFKNKSFSGNGRTCQTCHPAETSFTLSPEDVQARFAADPQDPLFLHDGTDDGLGNGVARILSDATIRFTRSLPAHVSIAGDPTTRSIVVARGIPTLLDLGVQMALPRPSLMADGRFASLEDQARGAVLAHYQARKLPTPEQLRTFATFQTSEAFFSSPELADLACGGPEVELPQGTTDSERRGREFFVPRPQIPGEPEHITCASCHAGPLLNEVRFSPGPVPDGHRFMDVFVSTLRARPEQLRDFVVTHPDGSVNTLTSADPGLLLTQGSFRCQPCTTNSFGVTRCGGCLPCSNFVEFNPALVGRENNICALLPGVNIPPPVGNNFKIPSLRGVSRTAPYFHDNSARTLQDVLAHYRDFFEFQFRRTETLLDGRLTPQQEEDIIAFMQLL